MAITRPAPPRGAPSRPLPPRPSPTSPKNSANVTNIQDIADVLYTYTENSDYMNMALRIAELIKRPVSLPPQQVPPQVQPSVRPPPPTSWGYQTTPAQTPQQRTDIWSPLFSVFRNVFTSNNGASARPPAPGGNAGRGGGVISVNNPPQAAAVSTELRMRGLKARSNLLDLTNEVSSFSTRAKNAGFEPPDNPFVEIARLQTLRSKNSVRVPVSSQEADDLIYNIQVYIDFIEAEAQKAIDLNQGVFNVAQLNHVSLSFTGLGGSGNAAQDLMRLLPNGDEIKKEKARAALAVLDFSKRIPNVIFTSDYSPNQDTGSVGTLIGFKKIPDASGYIIKRHSVLTGDDVEFEITNEQLKTMNDTFMDYARTYILTFYDKLDPSSVHLFLDKSPPIDDYFSYTIQAWQLRKNSTSSIIPSDYSVMNLTPTLKQAINFKIAQLSPGQETISPWPAFAEVLLGDPSLDWILAGVNCRASSDRKDSKVTTRQYSYLNANSSFLFTQSDAGQFVRFNSADAIKKAVTDSIQAYGVQQTIESLLEETGILYWFDGKDTRSDSHFDRAGTLDQNTSNLFGTLAAAIDPETAVVDLRSLASNLANLLGMKELGTSIRLAPAVKNTTSKPNEVDVIDPDDPNKDAESGVQFVSQLGKMDDAVVDLTTFDGISKLMRTIRIMSDFGPDRVQKPPTSVTLPTPSTNPTTGPTTPTVTTPPTTTVRPPPPTVTPRPTTPVPTYEDKADEADAKGKPALAQKLREIQDSITRTRGGTRTYEP